MASYEQQIDALKAQRADIDTQIKEFERLQREAKARENEAKPANAFDQKGSN